MDAPTLEGRVMVDLGQQLATMRAERDAARAEVARLKAILRRLRPEIAGMPVAALYVSELAIIDAALAAAEGA
jgi:uncharacterized protein involved in exopolysaccharide biosynthesis